jgi:hypothetical protein
MRIASAAEASEIVADPRWFAYRYDVQRDELQFAWLPREVHRSISFLSDPEPAAAPRRIIPRQFVADLTSEQGPLHLILHSGLCGSTLLARALDQEGVVLALKEPPILTDLVRHRLSGAPNVTPGKLLGQVGGLLARPLAAGEAVVIKMSSVGNLFGPEILAQRPTSRALCLHAPLGIFLASLARKGLGGRASARKLFIGLRNSGMAELGFSEKELFEQADLQLGADAWLAIHRILAGTAAQFGPERVRSADSERLTADPATVLPALAEHFRLDLDVASIMEGQVFRSHAKSGEAFDARRRKDELSAATAAHREELETVEAWARKVAEALRIPCSLPNPLIADQDSRPTK